MAYRTSAMTAMAALEEVPHPQRYSLDKLLSLRESLHVVYCPVERIHQSSALEIILRIPKEAFAKPNAFYCTTRDLIDEYKNHCRDISDFSSGDRSAEHSSTDLQMQSLDRSNQQVHWLLRGRDSSERIGQPFSAPTDLAAHQSENFQRFYRAVVSPTHVRVTAGGRIVPNTRTPAPPVFEWNADKFLFEPRPQHVASAPSQSTGSWAQRPSDLQHPLPLANNLSPIGNFLPGFQPIYHQHQQLAPPTMANQNIQPEGQKLSTGSGSSPPVAMEPVKLSPPAQFDHTKPFLYNGHWVYPVPPGFQPPPHAQPLPLSLLGTSRVGPQPSQAIAFQVPHHPMYQGNPLGLIPVGQHPVMVANGAHGPNQVFQNQDVRMVFAQNSLQPKPNSENIKMQIQSLRVQIKQMDDIIGSTRYQMDVGHLNVSRQAMVNFLSQLEAVLLDQLKNEGSPTSKSSGAPQVSTTTEHSTAVQHPTIVETPTVANPPMITEPLSGIEPGREGKTSSKSSDVAPSEPQRKSRLSASAAMAPPFKPRAQALTVSTEPITQGEFSRRSEETVEQTEARLLAAAPKDWEHTGASFFRSNKSFAPTSLRKSYTMHTTHPRRGRTTINVQDAYAKRGNTFHGQSDSISSLADPIVSRQGVPYLVGVSDHTSNQLTYPRELTDEELRARHLYWGKAPRSAQKGLPKFDGKDFYPPSPVKEFAFPVGAESPVKSHHTGKVPNFASLFTDHPDSPFKSPSTPAPEKRFQNNTLSPTRGAGYPSPMSRSANYPFHTTGYDDLAREFSTPENRTYDSFTPPPQEIVKDSLSQLFHGDPVKASHQPSHTYDDNEDNRAANDDSHSEGSWGDTKYSPSKGVNTGTTGREQPSAEEESDTSTVEIHLTPQTFKHSPVKTLPGTFAERVAAVNNPEKQNQFLQDMLRNTAKAAPPLSGSISNMTAQGYLPQYRGFAAASLAPSVNTSPAERDVMKDMDKSFSPLGSSSLMSENRPLHHERSRGAVSPMSAEDYMRLVSSMPHNSRPNAENGNIKDSGIGPAAGSDW